MVGAYFLNLSLLDARTIFAVTCLDTFTGVRNSDWRKQLYDVALCQKWNLGRNSITHVTAVTVIIEMQNH